MLSPVLVWPGLDVEAAQSHKRLPPRFARVAKHDHPKQDLAGLVASALRIKPPPAGPLARVADALGTSKHDWFRAEVVMWLPARDGFRMMPVDSAALEEDEAAALIATARAHFGKRLCLERGKSGRWYVALEDLSAVHTEALAVAIDQPLTPSSLGEGPDARRLRAFVNELQMLWHEHPVNIARRRAGQPEASALWLWGCGRLAAPPQVEGSPRLCADEPLTIALAQWLGLACQPLTSPAAAPSIANSVVVIAAGDELYGERWLAAFTSSKNAWQLHVAEAQWHIPARRRWFFRQG